MTYQAGKTQSDFLINNLICPTLLGKSKGQLGGSSNKSQNTLYPKNKCNLHFRAKMQVTSTLWSEIKSSTKLDLRFRLKWTKGGPNTQEN